MLLSFDVFVQCFIFRFPMWFIPSVDVKDLTVLYIEQEGCCLYSERSCEASQSKCPEGHVYVEDFSRGYLSSGCI